MIWSSGDTTPFFARPAARPTMSTSRPPTAVAGLDCSPGHVIDRVISGDDRPPEQILRNEVPAVVGTEQDPTFAPSAPDDWFWLGYDVVGNPVAFIARGDVELPEYHIYTCE